MVYTASCLCGTVRIDFTVPEPEKDVTPFICHCTDCRKVTATMFATNFTIANSLISSVQGRDSLTSWDKTHGIDSGATMTSTFCSRCGTLMWRASSNLPDHKVMRVGTVDDFSLHETILKPRIEQFTKDRVAWLTGATGVKQYTGNKLNTAKM